MTKPHRRFLSWLFAIVWMFAAMGFFWMMPTSDCQTAAGQNTVRTELGVLPWVEFQSTCTKGDVIECEPIVTVFHAVGFIVCTILTLVVAAIIIFSVRVLERYGRVPASHCDQCGYALDAAASASCPECGTRIPPAKDGTSITLGKTAYSYTAQLAATSWLAAASMMGIRSIMQSMQIHELIGAELFFSPVDTTAAFVTVLLYAVPAAIFLIGLGAVIKGWKAARHM